MRTYVTPVELNRYDPKYQTYAQNVQKTEEHYIIAYGSVG